MRASLGDLAVPLQRLAYLVEQLAARELAGRMPRRLQCLREVAQTLRGPAERRIRRACSRRLHQRIRIGAQSAILLDHALATAPRSADPLRPERRLGYLQLGEPPHDGGAGDPGSSLHEGETPATDPPGFGSGQRPAGALVQHRRQRRKRRILPVNRLDVRGRKAWLYDGSMEID
jgi:hypothetical protein